MILEELEKRFGNVLYLEVLENQMEVYKNPCEIRLLQAILGEMLKREWLIAQFVTKILNEKELPSLEFLIQISAQKYERRTVKSRIYFEYLRENGDLEFVREKDEGEWKEELLCLIRKKPDLHIDEKVITNLVNMLKEQKHGTSIVFMEQDILKWEKERLTEYKRGYQWEPFPLIENKDFGWGGSDTRKSGQGSQV